MAIIAGNHANHLTVAAIDLFRHVPPDISSSIARALSIKLFDAGACIVESEYPPKVACFVLSGTARISHLTRAGREVVLAERRAGECVGIFEQRACANLNFKTHAIEPTCAAFMRMGDFEDVLKRCPELLRRLVKQGSSFVRILSERFVELSALRVRYRIYSELLRLSCNSDGSRQTPILSPAPRHSELASRVSTHREAVTRELGRLERAGVIERDRGLLIIRDASYLRDAVRAML